MLGFETKFEISGPMEHLLWLNYGLIIDYNHDYDSAGLIIITIITKNMMCYGINQGFVLVITLIDQ